MPTAAACHRPLRLAAARPDDRPTTARRGYGSAWQRARAAFLAEHPLCECDECRGAGRLTPAEVVDHVTPHRGDATLFWDRANWRAMAKRCHDRKTAREDGGFGHRPSSA